MATKPPPELLECQRRLTWSARDPLSCESRRQAGLKPASRRPPPGQDTRKPRRQPERPALPRLFKRPMRAAAFLLILCLIAVACESPEDATRARFQERLKVPGSLTHAEVNQLVSYTLAAMGGRPVRVREQGAVRALDAKGRAEVLTVLGGGVPGERCRDSKRRQSDAARHRRSRNADALRARCRTDVVDRHRHVSSASLRADLQPSGIRRLRLRHRVVM